jgi:hypothetical protein
LVGLARGEVLNLAVDANGCPAAACIDRVNRDLAQTEHTRMDPGERECDERIGYRLAEDAAIAVAREPGAGRSMLLDAGDHLKRRRLRGPKLMTIDLSGEEQPVDRIPQHDTTASNTIAPRPLPNTRLEVVCLTIVAVSRTGGTTTLVVRSDVAVRSVVSLKAHAFQVTANVIGHSCQPLRTDAHRSARGGWLSLLDVLL